MPDSDSETSPVPTERELRQAMELLFFAYRDFTGDADALLADRGFGRAHHRALYFVGANPGMTVSDLLGILKITKQSLSRVLSQLVREGFVVQRAGPRDRRQRLLSLTEAGRELERRLADVQCRRLADAFAATGGPAVAGFRSVLRAMIDTEDRARVDGSIPPPNAL